MPASPSSAADKRRRFHELHRSGCFVIPNPWDLGSARYLQTLGFKALATTSSGFAWSQGAPDCGMSREEVLAHLQTMVDATDLPINADFQAGFAHEPAGVAESVRLAIETGVAGLSIEDSTGNAAKPLYDLDDAVARMRAARQAIDRAGGDTVLVGRAECFLEGSPDIEETIARLQAYANAGADCLYAPGIRSPEHIRRVVEGVAPKPVNLLVGHAIQASVAEIAELGVRRISVGGALARAAWGGFIRAAKMLAEQGRFEGFADTPSHDTLESLMRVPAGDLAASDR
ncbi:MAG TPA: isocitrate lyase/phosphoenolpyruvate mutase family protein [Steroidobacteraceae bacterium]|nr:isocitrate lyase/phosphoenolpyruvate mutase family protein [Steroidobacteraceae bacterium]